MSDNGNNDRLSPQSLLRDLDSYCSSSSLSEEGLRELFKRHGLTLNNDIGNFNYEFFLAACYNERMDEGIIRCLLEYFPDAARFISPYTSWSALHYACRNKRTTRGIIQLLIDAAPDSVGSVDNQGNLPLHCLCYNKRMNETASMQSLKFLVEKHPEAIRHVDNDGNLPIHVACSERSPEFCRVLIEAYPGSERIADADCSLPLLFACCYNTVATVQFLYKLYPDAINHATTQGYYPIHCAILGLRQQTKAGSAIETVQYLLDCDPNVLFQKCRGMSLLHYACRQNYNDSNVDAALEIIKAIYDAHPEAIEDNGIASTIQSYHQQVQAFINSELVFSRQAKDHSLMTTPDGNGQLPLHNAIQNNVRLGSIKLLVKGNPNSIQSPDNGGALPLHIACQHHKSANVIQYLVGLDTSTLAAADKDGNTTLHYACRCARYEIIALLLEKYDAVSVSRRNAHNKLPIGLLWESDEVEDRENIEYTDSVFRLLKAYPEAHLNYCANQQANNRGSST